MHINGQGDDSGGVEVFDSDNQPANDVVATSFSLLPGHSVLFGTRSGANALFTSSFNTPPIGNYTGAARILATSKKLVCTAFLADRTSAPPASMVYLTIIKKTKQKGE